MCISTTSTLPLTLACHSLHQCLWYKIPAQPPQQSRRNEKSGWREKWPKQETPRADPTLQNFWVRQEGEVGINILVLSNITYLRGNLPALPVLWLPLSLPARQPAWNWVFPGISQPATRKSLTKEPLFHPPANRVFPYGTSGCPTPPQGSPDSLPGKSKW